MSSSHITVTAPQAVPGHHPESYLFEDTSIGGMIYIFKSLSKSKTSNQDSDSESDKWFGQYTRTNAEGVQEPIVGDIEFDTIQSTIGNPLILKGKWYEKSTGANGDCEFEVTPNSSLSGRFNINKSTVNGDHYTNETDTVTVTQTSNPQENSPTVGTTDRDSNTKWHNWSSSKPILPSDQKFASTSLLPSQLQRVEAFNNAARDNESDSDFDYTSFGNFYTENDSIFVMYNIGKKLSAKSESGINKGTINESDIDVEKNGRKEITEWWKSAKLGTKFMKVIVPNKTVVLNKNMVWVSYKKVGFSSKRKDSESESSESDDFTVTVLGQTWVRCEETNRWKIKYDYSYAHVDDRLNFNFEQNGLNGKQDKALLDKILLDSSTDQMNWVKNFNSLNAKYCGDNYNQQNGFFCGFNGLGYGTIAFFGNGKKDTSKDKEESYTTVSTVSKTTLWWTGAQNGDLKLRNLRVDGDCSTHVIREDLIHAQYENFYFGNAEDENSIALKGEILCEVWKKNSRTGVWEVMVDFVCIK